jgi:hypothetical protein
VFYAFLSSIIYKLPIRVLKFIGKTHGFFKDFEKDIENRGFYSNFDVYSKPSEFAAAVCTLQYPLNTNKIAQNYH